MDCITLRFKVSRCAQTSGGGDYIVKFDAIVELIPDGSTSVVIESLHERSDRSLQEAARIAILDGFRSVLEQNNLKANCRVENLVLHPVDFKPRKFADCSAEALSAEFGKVRSSLPPP